MESKSDDVDPWITIILFNKKHKIEVQRSKFIQFSELANAMLGDNREITLPVSGTTSQLLHLQQWFKSNAVGELKGTFKSCLSLFNFSVDMGMFLWQKDILAAVSDKVIKTKSKHTFHALPLKFRVHVTKIAVVTHETLTLHQFVSAFTLPFALAFYPMVAVRNCSLRSLLPTMTHTDHDTFKRLIQSFEMSEPIMCRIITLSLELNELEFVSSLISAKHNISQTVFKQGIVAAAKYGNVACLNQLLAVCNPAVECSRALRLAAANGFEECVKSLIVANDPEVYDSEPLISAARHGFLNCVKILSPLCLSKRHRSLALCAAAQGGHTSCVECLIPVSDPSVHASYPLRAASALGFVGSVRALVSVSDPNVFHAECLQKAAREGHAECVNTLMPFITSNEGKLQALLVAARCKYEICVSYILPHCDESVMSNFYDLVS